MTVETTGKRRGKWQKWWGNDGNDGGNHLKMTNLWMPVTSLIMVQFSIRKKFWKALGLLYQMTVETTGNDGGNNGLVSCWILDWECYPPWFPHGILLLHLVSCLVCGLKLDWKCCPPWCRGFHPCGVVVSCLVLGSKLDWKCCPPWCRGFHPCGVVVSCLVHGLKLDWKFVSVVSPKWHHGVVSFSRWKQRILTLKSCDHSFQPIRRLPSVKSHTSLEKLWDFMQKEFPFKEQSCETALLKIKIHANIYLSTFQTPKEASQLRKIKTNHSKIDISEHKIPKSEQKHKENQRRTKQRGPIVWTNQKGAQKSRQGRRSVNCILYIFPCRSKTNTIHVHSYFSCRF